MKRTSLVAAVSIAPLLLIIAGAASATDTITGSGTTPVATATATSGGPDNVDVASGGSIGPTTAGPAVTLNSNNTVTNEGSIGSSNVDGGIGIQVNGGFTGAVTNSGTIAVTETYAPTDTNQDGLIDGAYAQGTNRTGILVVGPGTFNGSITNIGTVSIKGNNSQGVSIQAPITGSYDSLKVTPASGSTAATIANGSISVLGDNTIGFQVTPTGSIGGNLRLTGITANGVNTQGAVINGAVGGQLSFTGAITATGYRSASRSNYPTLANRYTAQELSQGGTAVTIGGNVGAGVIVSAPPQILSTTNLDLDNNGVPDSIQGAASISSFGAAPAFVIGRSGANVELGLLGVGSGVTGEGGPGSYGLAIQGSITGTGVFDPQSTPHLPGVVSGTAMQIGVAGGGAAIVDGGIYITGSVAGQAYQANATAMHFLSGASTPLILNDGLLSASSTQVNAATTGVAPVNVYGIVVDAGATLTSLTNNNSIVANITGTGGVGGTVGAVIDRSGTLATVVNTGAISAQATQTLITSPMPATLTAIDMSAGTGPQSITQKVNPNLPTSTAYASTSTYALGNIVNYNGLVYEATTAVAVSVDPVNYPSYWRELGSITPTISGSVYFGSGGSTLDVSAGSVTGSVIQLGTGVNTLNIHGASGSGITGATVTGAILEGALQGGGNSTLTINVNNGTLSDTNPNTIKVKSVNVGANGLLLVSADPVNGTNTKFVTSGASVFAQGAQVGLTLRSLPKALTQTYTILQTVPGQGTLSAGTFATGLLDNAPFLFTANASYVAASDPSTQSSEIQLTVTRKSAAQLGFNAAESAALDAVLAAAPNTAGIQTAILSQTTQAGLKATYDQLLPDQGQGLFDSIDSAVRSIANMTGTVPNPNSRLAGSNLWLQEVNERVKRSGTTTVGSFSKLLGIVGGYEHVGAGGGAAGVSLAYFNASETAQAEPIGGGVQSSSVEIGGYYRRSAGPLSASARVGVGYSWLQDNRKFLTAGTAVSAQSNWGALFFDGHFGVAYEQKLGRFYARPELSADFLQFDEGSHTDKNGSAGFNLTVASRNSSRFSGQAVMVVGREWGTAASWLRSEVRGGFREILAGSVGDTTANFAGGTPFTLAAENDKGGWLTFGFSLKAGSPYSYLALEGDADYRKSEQRYDLRIAGRSLF